MLGIGKTQPLLCHTEATDPCKVAESGVSLDIQSNIQKGLFAWTEVGLDPHTTKLD